MKIKPTNPHARLRELTAHFPSFLALNGARKVSFWMTFLYAFSNTELEVTLTLIRECAGSHYYPLFRNRKRTTRSSPGLGGGGASFSLYIISRRPHNEKALYPTERIPQTCVNESVSIRRHMELPFSVHFTKRSAFPSTSTPPSLVDIARNMLPTNIKEG